MQHDFVKAIIVIALINVRINIEKKKKTFCYLNDQQNYEGKKNRI